MTGLLPKILQFLPDAPRLLLSFRRRLSRVKRFRKCFRVLQHSMGWGRAMLAAMDRWFYGFCRGFIANPAPSLPNNLCASASLREYPATRSSCDSIILPSRSFCQISSGSKRPPTNPREYLPILRRSSRRGAETRGRLDHIPFESPSRRSGWIGG